MNCSISNAVLRAIRRVLRAADQGERRLAVATGLPPSPGAAGNRTAQRDDAKRRCGLASVQPGDGDEHRRSTDRDRSGDAATRRARQTQMLLRLTEAGQSMPQTAPDLLQNQFQNRFGALPAWEQAMIPRSSGATGRTAGRVRDRRSAADQYRGH